MMAMFGWTDPNMPALYIANANREKLGMTGMDKVVAFDRGQSLDNFMPMAEANSAGTPGPNKVVALRSNFEKRGCNFRELRVGMVRSEGLEPPRCYSLPPQGSASTNSATSAKRACRNLRRRRRCNKSAIRGQGRRTAN